MKDLVDITDKEWLSMSSEEQTLMLNNLLRAVKKAINLKKEHNRAIVELKMLLKPESQEKKEHDEIMANAAKRNQ